jgi:hypothetical protein
MNLSGDFRISNCLGSRAFPGTLSEEKPFFLVFITGVPRYKNKFDLLVTLEVENILGLRIP